MKKRGYYGVAIFEPKFADNIGTVMRNAMNFDADFIATIGKRYKKEATDTTDTTKHIPLFHYATLDEFKASINKNCPLVAVEVGAKTSLITFVHPERAVYLFGGEDRSLDLNISSPDYSVSIPTNHCMNLAVTTAVVMYDRLAKTP